MKAHDQRFKTLLREFFIQFLTLFFPKRAANLDLASLQWLDKELLPDPPEGEVLEVDLLVRVPRRPPKGKPPSEELVSLVHVEVESRDAIKQFRRRMYDYYHPLSRRHGKPVLPIAVYLRVGLEGIGMDTYEEYYEELRLLKFEYPYVGLPALDAEQYVAGDNWLGVALAVLMKARRDRKAWVRGEALRRILVECPENEYRKLLLCECVEAYTELDPKQQRAYEQLLKTEPYREVVPMMQTTFEKGIVKGQRGTLRLQLERRFGPLPPAVQKRLEEWPAERLEELTIAVLDAPSLQALGLVD